MSIILIISLGLAFGSFAGCASYRLATKQSLLTKSKCPKCHTILRVKNLIPIFSWILQNGKCSKCKYKISLRYLIIEIFFVAIFLLIFYMNEKKLDWNLLLILLCATTLMIMAIVDVEHYFIPDILQIILAILAIILTLYSEGFNGLINNFLAAIFYFAFGAMLYFAFYYFQKIEALGRDDIKFLAVAGLLLGMNKFLVFILIVGIIGIIFGSLWERIKKDDTFPFAPALCSSALICLLLNKSYTIL